MKDIIKELSFIIDNTNFNTLDPIAKNICQCKGSVVGIGSGRMGYSLKAFIMRLNHLGKSSFFIDDCNVPSISHNDLVIVNSSSGETEIIFQYVKIAKRFTDNIILFTQNDKSRIASLSNFIFKYSNCNSKQLLKTINEQFTYLLFDYLVIQIFRNLKLTKDQVFINHSNLE